MQARLTRILAEGLAFDIYSEAKFCDLVLSFVQQVRPVVITTSAKNCNTTQIELLIKDHILYIGFSMRDGTAGWREMFRFALDSQGPPFVRRTGVKITNPQDLLDTGFTTLILHETSFAYNARRLETALQAHFWDERNRLWRARGAGNYYTSDRHIKVLLLLLLLLLLLPTRLQDQHDHARISKLFITYAPASVSEQLLFAGTLPLRIP